MAEKVLVADDDPDIRRFVEINLRLEGFEVSTAEDGEEALRMAAESKPDLVLLDIMMPRMDGLETCQRLRSDPRTSNICIIMLTAKTMSAEKVVGLTVGADDYIIKPFDPLELVARVRSTLRRAHQMRDLNPLTGLPGNAVIVSEIQRRIATRDPFALMYVDLDNFKSYNDHYGFARGDLVIKLVATILEQTVQKRVGDLDFVGHIGGDDFVLLTEPSQSEELAQEVIQQFDEQIPALYDPADVGAGYITVMDRKDEPHNYPLISISIGIATNLRRNIYSHWEASEIAAEMKQFAKKQQGSSYAVDRRTGPGDAAGPLPDTE